MKGWPANFSFERIIITAVSKNLPRKIINQLADEGILILPLEYKNEQYITKVTKKNRKLYFKKYWRVQFVPLVSGIN
jgi:protein-L-isoaspartate(D-aspartate) O-methyltransferase